MRPYKNQEYQNWRNAVMVRDKFLCRWPSGKHRGKLQVHHIKKWYSHTHLRYSLSNGITLCRRHHRLITGREEDYERILAECLSKEMLLEIKQMLYDLDT